MGGCDAYFFDLTVFDGRLHRAPLPGVWGFPSKGILPPTRDDPSPRPPCTLNTRAGRARTGPVGPGTRPEPRTPTPPLPPPRPVPDGDSWGEVYEGTRSRRPHGTTGPRDDVHESIPPSHGRHATWTWMTRGPSCRKSGRPSEVGDGRPSGPGPRRSRSDRHRGGLSRVEIHPQGLVGAAAPTPRAEEVVAR